MSRRIDMLAGAVALLASDPPEQLEHLCGLELPEAIDELALEFDSIAAARDHMLHLGELDRRQYDSVVRLDDLLSRMSGAANARLWTKQGLMSAPEWKEVRTAARECLRLIELKR